MKSDEIGSFHDAMRNVAKEIGLRGGMMQDMDVLFFGSSIEVLELYNVGYGDIDAAERELRDELKGGHDE